MTKRLFWFGLVLVLVLAACHDTKSAKDGEKVIACAGEHVIVGSVRIDVESRDEALVIHMNEGARNDTRHVTGDRVVKFGAHKVRFNENGARVEIVVRAYTPPSPLTSDDALLAADEAMSPKSDGPVDCASATLSPDGATFIVHCRDTNRTDSDHIVKVDAATGAIRSI